MLERVLEHLAALVAFDTTNPPRRIGADGGIVGYVAGVLADAAMDVQITAHGDGCVNVLATRGVSDLLLQCHLDTVPADPAWTGDPHALAIRDGLAIGLGACDVKGGAACILAALERSDAPVSVLFTTDEEAGSACCVRTFLDGIESGAQLRPGVVLVCEPTECMGVTSHRGIGVAEIEFAGTSAHTSRAGATDASAVHRAIAWGSAALAAASDGALADCRLNVGVIEGGVKANMAAPAASVTFGVRPPGGRDPADVIAGFVGLAREGSIGEWRTRFLAPGLAEDIKSTAFIEACGIEHAGSVDFWTEASLFGERGIPAVVFGPGSIAQAHAAGEFVATAQLERASAAYVRCIELAANRQAAHA